jgi:hypothetical protein
MTDITSKNTELSPESPCTYLLLHKTKKSYGLRMLLTVNTDYFTKQHSDEVMRTVNTNFYVYLSTV